MEAIWMEAKWTDGGKLWQMRMRMPQVVEVHATYIE